jgi:hypothetical protein
LKDENLLERLDQIGREQADPLERHPEGREITGIRAQQQVSILLVMAQPDFAALLDRFDQRW